MPSLIDLLSDDATKEATDDAGLLKGLNREERAKIRALIYACNEKAQRLLALRDALRAALGIGPKRKGPTNGSATS